MESQRKFSEVFYNPITYLGVVLTLLIFITEGFLFAIDFVVSGGNLYLGLLTYCILPGLLFLGIFLIVVGVLWKRRRIRKGLVGGGMAGLRIDLSIPAHRNGLIVFIIGSSILILMSMVGSYQAYHYTESVPFCGTLCHVVMEPEFTTYTNSPHGKVKCVDCHIGSGADWYVKSKASGLRQVVRTMMDSYHRPIKTPIENLRPAAETCLECHWPGKFYSTMDFNRTYYLGDQANTPWKVRILLNVGAGESQGHGVHAHMNFDQDIYYAAEDDRRQKITWVKTVSHDGHEKIYTTKSSKFNDSPPKADEVRKMDCIDCHNRPTHQFLPPDRLVNEAMYSGEISKSLPGIKGKAVNLLSKEYVSLEEANSTIERELTTAFGAGNSETSSEMSEKASRAIEVLKSIYARNMFPDMKTRWDVHPDNIGHLNFPGCFRCHDNKHKTSEGDKISNDCQACHLIIEQGPLDKLERDIAGLEFKHPDGEEDWKTTACTKCHTGGPL